MICPKCRYEYRHGITVCPDCEEPLVAQLNSRVGAAAVPDDTWVGVCALSGTTTIKMAKGALDSSNIPSLVVARGFAPGALDGGCGDGLSSVLGNAEIVLVPREYLEDAAVILEVVLGDDFVELG